MKLFLRISHRLCFEMEWNVKLFLKKSTPLKQESAEVVPAVERSSYCLLSHAGR